MDRKGMSQSLAIMLAFVLAALVIVVSAAILSGGVESLESFIKPNLNINLSVF
jgi:hypothetical protein